MILRSLLVSAALMGALATPARAEEPAVSPGAGPSLATVFAFGADNPDCLEWGNACQICKRDDAGAPQCSTSGIACTPGETLCKSAKPKQP